MFVIALFKKTSNEYSKNLLNKKVSVIVPAYNEALIIEQKIKNLLSLNKEGLAVEIIFITDGSTDNSVDIIHQFPAIQYCINL